MIYPLPWKRKRGRGLGMTITYPGGVTLTNPTIQDTQNAFPDQWKPQANWGQAPIPLSSGQGTTTVAEIEARAKAAQEAARLQAEAIASGIPPGGRPPGGSPPPAGTNPGGSTPPPPGSSSNSSGNGTPPPTEGGILSSPLVLLVMAGAVIYFLQGGQGKR